VGSGHVGKCTPCRTALLSGYQPCFEDWPLWLPELPPWIIIFAKERELLTQSRRMSKV
jgi:hypothetical protein